MSYLDDASPDDAFTETPTVVIDNGSKFTKFGLAGDPRVEHTNSALNGPKCCGCRTMPTMVGETRRTGCGYTLPPDYYDYYVGEEAQQKRGVLILRYPVERGVIQNWPNMERIWKHIFDIELRVTMTNDYFVGGDYAGGSVLLTDLPRFNSYKEDRERMTQIMFEDYNVGRMYVAIGAVLSLFTSGRTTGVTVDIGDSLSSVVPVFEGYSIDNMVHPAGRYTHVAGREIHDYACQILNETGIRWNTNADRLCAIPIRENMCYLANDFDEEIKGTSGSDFGDRARKFEMPDGSTVDIHNQLIRVPEMLFQPSLGGFLDIPGIHERTHQVIDQCDADLKELLYDNIVACGGSTAFPNFAVRLEMGVKTRAVSRVTVSSFSERARWTNQAIHAFNLASNSPSSPASVLGNRMRQHVASFLNQYDVHPWAEPMCGARHSVPAAWIGGSILASLSTFSQNWMYQFSRPNASPPVVGYDDVGPRIVHMMCNM